MVYRSLWNTIPMVIINTVWNRLKIIHNQPIRNIEEGWGAAYTDGGKRC